MASKGVYAQDSRERERLATERAIVAKFKTSDLIAELGNNDFYRREAAQAELTSRGRPGAVEALKGLWNRSPEIALRSERVLDANRKDYVKDLKLYGPPIAQIRAERPRFWQGPNGHLGNRLDKSFDSDLQVECLWPVVEVQTPVQADTYLLPASVWTGARNSRVRTRSCLGTPVIMPQ